MTTMANEHATRGDRTRFDARYMWSSLSITAMWLAALIATAFGPDVKSVEAGGSSTTIPAGVIFAILALFGTISVAKRGLTETTEH
jgi:hypothetical protein